MGMIILSLNLSFMPSLTATNKIIAIAPQIIVGGLDDPIFLIIITIFY
jgi:hypothetical protein